VRRLPGHLAPLCFGVAQSFITCGVAAAISSLPFVANGTFVPHLLKAWLTACATMVPIVLVIARPIRRIVRLIVDD